MSDVAVTQIVSFLVGVISSLAAAGIIASFSPSFRFWCRKNYRIVKTSIRNAKITRFVNSSNSIGDRTLNVGIILNGTSPYLVDMEEAFIHEAKNLLGNKGILIHVERSQGTHNSNKARNSKVINELFSKFSNSKPDIVVTFGSGVSTYIRKYHKDIPQIFVGVTDPIASELCNSLDSDTARGDVCGVTFSITAVDRIEFLKTVFPHKRIGFVYNPKYLADIHHLKNFREEMIKNNWNFTEISID
ncbi:MAG TPA: ABC transporter substrate binding protein, partial [Pyrinomonadaceae bacterium]|nr:ABC transporter substrate binding protein [Pyrinomonadaceae bacterium]